MGEVFVVDPYRAPGLAECTLSARFATELALELEPGERVVWTGVPRRLALLRRVIAELWLPVLGAWGAMKTTFYAVTDRRALVFDAEGIWAASRAEIVGVKVRAGDIALSVRRRGLTAMVGVPDARRVAELLR